MKRNIEVDRKVLGIFVSPGRVGAHAHLLYEVRYANGKQVVVRGATLRVDPESRALNELIQIANLAIGQIVEGCLENDQKLKAKDMITYGNVLPGDAFERPQRKPRRKLAA